MATDSQPNESGFRGPLTRLEMLDESAFAYVLLVPAFALLALVAFYPLLATFRFSLLADATRGVSPFGEYIGLQNYVDVLRGDAQLPRQFVDIALTSEFPFITLGTPFFRQALLVTLAFAILSVFFETIIGFGQALVLDQDFHGRRWVRVAIIIPWAIPVVIQAMIFYLMFQPTIGFATGWMQTLGIFGSTPLADSSSGFIIVLVADVWKTTAFMALLILAGLQSVDRSLYDVARVSGASTLQRFRYITLPLVMPALLVAMLFRTMDAMRIYGVIDATVGCSTVPSLTCLVIISLDQTRQWATAATVAFMTAVVIAIFVAVYLWRFRETEGGFA